MRTKSVKEILKNQAYWAPVIDGIVVKHQPKKALTLYSKQEENPRIPLMYGITSEEGLYFIKQAIPVPVPNILSIYDIAVAFSFPLEMAKIVDLYRNKDFFDIREDVARLASDFAFRCPRRNLIAALFAEGKTDMWAYMVERNNMNLGDSLAVCSKRACHMTELVFIFQTFEAWNYTPLPEDLNLSNALTGYHRNFLMHGDPNGQYSATAPDPLPLWQGVKDSGSEFRQLHFQKDGTLKLNDLQKDEKCDMWDERGYLTWFIN